MENVLNKALEQWGKHKEQYPGVVLLFRVGDVFQAFYDDAQLLRKVLGIGLTGKDTAAGVISIASLESDKIEAYLKRIIMAGHKVALCEPSAPVSKHAGEKNRPSLEQAKAQYVHRFTMEHIPAWAKQQRPDGSYYAPHFRTDAEWYENTVFPPANGQRKYCTTSGETWPLGQSLDKPFTK